MSYELAKSEEAIASSLFAAQYYLHFRYESLKGDRDLNNPIKRQ